MRQLVIVGGLTLAIASPAAAQSLTFSSPGSYTLSADVVSAGSQVIAITSSNVTLNLNGRTVRGAPSNPSSAVTMCIVAQNVSNVTIRNGSITGCMFGLFAGYSANITIEDVNFSGNTYIGAHLAWGSGHIVRRSIFANIAGYTVEAYAIGINGTGSTSTIEDNRFENLYPQAGSSTTGEGLGVLVEQGATGVNIRRNLFKNATVATKTIGVWMANGTQGIVSQNSFENLHTGIASLGTLTADLNTITMLGTSPTSVAIAGAAGVASNNTITGYATAFEGSISNGGGNIITTTTPPPPPPSGGKFFRICADGLCYEGTLYPVSGV